MFTLPFARNHKFCDNDHIQFIYIYFICIWINSSKILQLIYIFVFWQIETPCLAHSSFALICCISQSICNPLMITKDNCSIHNIYGARFSSLLVYHNLPEHRGISKKMNTIILNSMPRRQVMLRFCSKRKLISTRPWRFHVCLGEI